MHRSLFTLAALALACTAAQADVCRVTPTGSAAASGADWGANALSLPGALGKAECTELWLLKGIYTPSGPLAVTRDVKVYGGFDGVETALGDRSAINASATILNGQGAHRVLEIKAETADITAATLIDGLSITLGHSSQGGGGACVAAAGRQCSPVLRNVQFRSNQATNSGGAWLAQGAGRARFELVLFDGNQATQQGGAVAISAEGAGVVAAPVFDAAYFANNSAGTNPGHLGGGAVSIHNRNGAEAHPVFRNAQFDANTSPLTNGGAVAVAAGEGSANPVFERSHFINNDAPAGNGGAVYVMAFGGGSSQPVFTGSSFDNNHAQKDGGAVHLMATGSGSRAGPRFSGAMFHANRAERSGGAVSMSVVSAGQAHPEFSRTTFVRNGALSGHGGAVYTVTDLVAGGTVSPRFIDSHFDTNEAELLGGAYHGHTRGESNPEFIRTSFGNNKSTTSRGGALSFQASNNGQMRPLLANVTLHGNEAADEGGAIRSFAEHAATLALRLVHVTMTSNTAPVAAASAFSVQNAGSGTHTMEMANSIVWGNGSGNAYSISNVNVDARRSIIQDGCGMALGLNCDPFTSANNLTDPQLLGFQHNGGFGPTRVPQAGSPAIDAAGTGGDCLPTDQRGIARPQGSACDMGAVEARGAANLFTLTVQVAGSGSVSATPGILTGCTASGGACSSTYTGENQPSSVLVLASAQPDMPYVVWGGACTAEPAQPEAAWVSMDGDKTCQATFSATNPNPGPGPGPNPGSPTAVPATGPLGLALLAALVGGFLLPGELSKRELLALNE